MVSQRAHQSFLLQDVVVPVFTHVPVIRTPLDTHGVQQLVTDSTKYLWASWKIHLQRKNPGHSLTDCMCYLNSDSITLWCCSGDAVQCRGDRTCPLHPPMVTDSRAKQLPSRGRTEIHPVPLQGQCTSVSLCPQRAWNILPLCVQGLMHGQER